MKLTKEKLHDTLLLVQNKLKNNIVRSELEKYIDTPNTLDNLEKIINYYINSIDNIYAIENREKLNTLANNLNEFIKNTESTTTINLYYVKIIDSINFIVNSVSEYERKDFEDKDDYFVERMTENNPTEKENSIYKESEAEQIIVEHLLNDKGYPSSSIKPHQILYKSHYRPDIIISHNDVILAVIEIKKSRTKDIVTQLVTYYDIIIENQIIKPKLFTIFFSESFNTFYEYSMGNKRIGSSIKFPNYNELIIDSTAAESTLSKFNWDRFIQTIDLNKLSNVKRGIEDDNFQEAIKVRDFLKNYDKELRQKIPSLRYFNSKLNSHPNQSQWTPENGFRYSYFINNKYLDGIQLNITLWANWKGGVFIKDNANIIFSDKELLEKLTQEYSELIFRREHNDIFAKSFSDGICDESTLIKSINTLISLLKDVDKEKYIFGDSVTQQDSSDEIYSLNNGLTIASQQNDNPEGDDSLDITPDVNALAKLIAYKKLEPPLSIGLFGEWGSGKSFFMNEVNKKIHTLSHSDNKIFCQNIVHIKFNAWHYSDSNLWASLVSKIFKALNTNIKNTNEHSLFEELQSSKDRLQEIENEKILINKDIKEKKSKLKQKEKEKIEESIKIRNSAFISAVPAIFDEKDTKKELESLKDDLEEVSVEQEYDINSFISLAKDITTVYGTLKRFFIVFSNDKLFIWWIIGLTVLSLLTAFLVSHYLEKQYFLQIVTPLVAFSIPILIKVSLFINKLKQFSPKINTFLDNYELKKEEILKANNKLDIEYQNNLDKLVNEINKIELDVDSSIDDIHKLDNEINDIKSGKYLADFISERSDDYKSRLGLISIIRDDFEKLSSYLKDESSDIKIDRIVLYIDDLDRCTNDLVIDVLEAIHLLLAFDLFVVIVGVDIRWVSHSLDSKYDNLAISETPTDKATPLEYLEKIFQIPFHLKTITDKSKKNLIEKLLAPSIENKKQSIDGNHTLTDGNDTLVDSNIEKTQENSLDEVLESDNIKEFEHQHLEVSIEELNYIKELSSLIFSSPRSVKRFINIYMIIRSHEKIHHYQDKKHYQAIIFLLTIVFIDPKSLLPINNQDSLNKLIEDTDLSKVSDEVKKSIESLQFNIVKEHLEFLLRFSFRS